MGIALNTSIPKGIMGIAFDNGEAGGTVQYPNLVDTMVNQSVIATQAYSLWLDDYGQYRQDILKNESLTTLQLQRLVLSCLAELIPESSPDPFTTSPYTHLLKRESLMHSRLPSLASQ